MKVTVKSGTSVLQVRKLHAGLLIWEQTPGAAPTSYTYDGLGRVHLVKQHVVNDIAERTTTIDYDPIYGQPETVTTVGRDGKSSKTKKTYLPPTDPNAGRLKTSSVIKKDAPTNLESETLTTYSAWTPRGELRGQWGATYPVRYTYDAAGRLWKMETYRNDPAGTPPAGSDLDTWIEASKPGNWPAGDVTEWVYHSGTMALQQKKDATGKGASYTYHPEGTLATRTWARGVVATYTHNRLGELTGISYSDGMTPNVALTRNADGRLASVADGTGVRSYHWRTDGRLGSEALESGSALLYGYDAAGRRTNYAWWDAATVSYATWGGWGYDATTGQLSGISTPEGFLMETYDPATGQPTGVSGAFSSDTQRDTLGRITTVTGTPPNITGHDGNTVRTYGYNSKGQRESLMDETNAAWHYDYNSKDEQLSQEEIDAINKYLNDLAGGKLSPVDGTNGWTYSGDINNANKTIDSLLKSAKGQCKAEKNCCKRIFINIECNKETWNDYQKGYIDVWPPGRGPAPQNPCNRSTFIDCAK